MSDPILLTDPSGRYATTGSSDSRCTLDIFGQCILNFLERVGLNDHAYTAQATNRGGEPIYLFFDAHPAEALAYQIESDTQLLNTVDIGQVRLIRFWLETWRTEYAQAHGRDALSHATTAATDAAYLALPFAAAEVAVRVTTAAQFAAPKPAATCNSRLENDINPEPYSWPSGKIDNNRPGPDTIYNVGSAGRDLRFPAIKTYRDVAYQSNSDAALRARSQVAGGARLYRFGTLGVSDGPEGQYWALENPTNPGYAQRHGIPPENVINANFIEYGRLAPGAQFITRPAPGAGVNLGGGIEVVVNRNDVILEGYTMP